jgi:hypothetical protein
MIRFPPGIAVVAGAQLPGAELEERAEIEADEAAGSPGGETAVRPVQRAGAILHQVLVLGLFKNLGYIQTAKDSASLMPFPET